MNNLKTKRIIKKWNRRGKPIPPPHVVKQSIIRSYQQKYNAQNLVETGTFRGEMLIALKDEFKQMYSIELSKELYDNCVEKLTEFKHIHLYQGDSVQQLPKILEEISGSILFWLDSHYSGGNTGMGESETPIFQELEIIFKKPDRHIILIDDARCFGNPDHPEYPTLDQVKVFVEKQSIKFQLTVEDDIIRILPI